MPIVFKERIYKIWKQFTTAVLYHPSLLPLCSKNEYTKSESNSQHIITVNLSLLNCVQRTNIQNLKAIHNHRRISLKYRLDCVQRTNIQNLKAIHNIRHRLCAECLIVFKERIYKIWKQFTTRSEKKKKKKKKLCSKNEYTKSESNSQRVVHEVEKILHCVQRTNIQNLKAIHNYAAKQSSLPSIVFKERIYKIWKQFTT